MEVHQDRPRRFTWVRDGWVRTDAKCRVGRAKRNPPCLLRLIMISESNKHQPAVKIAIGVLCASFGILLAYGLYREITANQPVDNVGRSVVVNLFFMAVCCFCSFAMIASALSRKLSHKFFHDAEISDEECRKCLYDLTGSALGGSKSCPECGTDIPIEQIVKIKNLDQKIDPSKDRTGDA